MGIRVKGEASNVKINDTEFLDIKMEKVGTPNRADDSVEIKENAESKD